VLKKEGKKKKRCDVQPDRATGSTAPEKYKKQQTVP
jgi:hypothetical protein